MKNTVKRLMSALMAASMLAAVTAGCGGSADTTAPADTAAADTASDAAAETEEADLGPVLTRIKESGKMVLGTASGYMPYEFIDISSADQEVIGVDMAMGAKIAEKLSEKLGVAVEMEIEDTTFTNTLVCTFGVRSYASAQTLSTDPSADFGTNRP